MKKLILTAVLLCSIIGMAQSRKDRSQTRNQFTPEQKATLKSKKMALHLDLTDQQEQQVYQLFLDNAKQAHKRMTDEERKNLSSDERFKHREKIMDRKIELKRALKNILNENQYAMLQKKHHARAEKRKHRPRKS